MNNVSGFLQATFGLALAAGIAAMAISMAPDVVSAQNDGKSKADVTFTKWVTDTNFPAFPWDMQGVVGGDAGPGTFTGEVVNQVTQGTTTVIHALYHFNGQTHSFTADLFITKDETTGHGEVTLGVVTNGWLMGSKVTGGWDTLATCDIATPGNIFGATCFKGTLEISHF